MYLMYVINIYILTLLKISSAIVTNLIILRLMLSIRYLSNDKGIFTKQIIKIRRWIYGYKTINK